MSKKTAFNKLSNAPANAISPLNQGQFHIGTDKIKIKLIDWPDEKRFKAALSKMVQATVGGEIDKDIPEEVGEELFRGGLQTGLEAAILTFEISGVSRAFTHQLVRTRKATYHQQSSRYTNMGKNFNVRVPESIMNSKDAYFEFMNAARGCQDAYAQLIDLDIPFQDARFICPIGIETYIIAEYPLKTFLDTYAYRACPMFQWEMVFVFREMKKLVVEKFPWMEEHIKISCERTKRCMFQGWEETESQCNFPWAGDRIFQSKIFTPIKGDIK